MGPKELENYYDRLRKKGRAIFKVIFKAAPGDRSFLEADPVANVTVISKDPTTGDVIFTQAEQMSVKAGEREVEIEVRNVVGVVKNFLYNLSGKGKPEPYEVTIIVEPHPDWEDTYSRKEFPLSVKAGHNSPEHVWMLRKKSERSVDKPQSS